LASAIAKESSKGVSGPKKTKDNFLDISHTRTHSLWGRKRWRVYLQVEKEFNVRSQGGGSREGVLFRGKGVQNQQFSIERSTRMMAAGGERYRADITIARRGEAVEDGGRCNDEWKKKRGSLKSRKS